MEAIFRTAELSGLKLRYASIRQDTKEPYLPFVERLLAAIEKQVYDASLREVLVKQLARDNANADCQKIIDALPGDPSLDDMVQACSKVGSVDHKMTALANAMAAVTTTGHRCASCSKKGYQKTEYSQKSKNTPTQSAITTCLRCGKVGHFAKNCQSTHHADGHVLSGNMCSDTSTCPDRPADPALPETTSLCDQLSGGTKGAAGMDVSTASTVTISTMGVHQVPLDAWGPIGRGLSALIIGRSSVTIQGIMAYVGVVNADYTGQICAMVSTPTPPLCTEKGMCIAQLIPFMSCVPRTKKVIQGTGGFGFTGVPQVHWTQTVKDHRSQMTCVLSMAHASPATAKVSGLLDTGADITIILLKDWPTSWALVPASHTVVGLGGTSTGCLTAKLVLITNPEGQTATLQPYVIAAPLNLWERDCLSQWGVRITTYFP
ncbi:hypothetical protein BTVI_09727 [Pitangus sulphuratus]|nr:hypothetical protein BTVI_09727 [Pitangus sulphuratus]